MFHKFRQRAYEVLWVHDRDDVLAERVNVGIGILIILNVALVIIESVENIGAAYRATLRAVEFVSVIIFTVEYLLRLWTAALSPKFKGILNGQIHFVISPLGVVDLLAILPFYLGPLFPYDLRFVRALRLVRLFRVLKLARYSNAVQTIGRVIRATSEQLIVVVFVVVIVLVLAGGGLYLAEREAQPEAYPSIPASMWWCLRIMAKVGPGDTFPVTVWGNGFAALTGILGIAVLALPAGVLSSGFIQEMRRQKEHKTTQSNACPHCGHSVE